MVLLVAIIVLGLLFLAGLGVMRAADTSNVISGNFSFQQAAAQASDRAVTESMTWLLNNVPGGGGNTAAANRYLPLRATALDSRGIPSAINWDGGVTCIHPDGGVIDVNACATDDGTYRIQYVIERMCGPSAPDLTDINDIRAKCEYEPRTTPLSPATTAAGIAVRYRVVIRVRGPRGTDGFYEVMVSGPAG